jgi:hypothetical protein
MLAGRQWSASSWSASSHCLASQSRHSPRWIPIGGGGGRAAQTVEADFSAVSTEGAALALPISVRTLLEAWTLSPPRRVLNLA